MTKKRRAVSKEFERGFMEAYFFIYMGVGASEAARDICPKLLKELSRIRADRRGK